MKKHIFCALSNITFVMMLLIIVATANSAPIATSYFSSNDEGWKLVTTLGYNGPVTWSSTGHFIYGQDPDTGAFGFSAPSKFLGNVSAAYGQLFTFDVAALTLPVASTSWVGISGAGYQLICNYNTPTSVYPDWYTRSITLHENAGWINLATGLAPTHAQMLAVLTNMTGLVIATEFIDGFESDIAGIDNVILIPEPATMLLLPLGIVWLRRK